MTYTIKLTMEEQVTLLNALVLKLSRLTAGSKKYTEYSDAYLKVSRAQVDD